MLSEIILTPPVVFIIIFVTTLFISSVLARLAYRGKSSSTKSYSCGEEVPTHLIQPDYGAFFPFAFFFTILHVVALIITTVPVQTLGSFLIAVIYILGAATALFILFRR